MKEIFQRINQYLLFSVLLTVVLYYGRTILIPVVLAAFFAMLLVPVCRKLDKRGAHRSISSLICIFILVIALLAILAIVVAQVSSFTKDLPMIEEKFDKLVTESQGFIEEKLNITPAKQESLFKEQITGVGKAAGKMISAILGGITASIAGLVLTLVYTFLFLYNKEKYETFFVRLYKEEEPAKVKKLVGQISHVAQQYLTGRVISVLILVALYSIGLLIVGIKNAILLAGIAALLTIIPYVGSILGGLFPFLMALVTEDSIQPALWTGIVLIFIQAVDNYFIEPRIVGGEVNLGALPTILSIIAGGLIWGAAGMILFLPMLGIAKIIFDHVESLKPYGYLIGDPDSKHPSKLTKWIREKFKV